MIKAARNSNLARYGFSFERGGAHTSRTMMLKELALLFTYVSDPEAPRSEYVRAIDEDNCLGKRSGSNPQIQEYRHKRRISFSQIP